MLRLFTSKSKSIKVELTSEVDILFFYMVSIEWDNFETELKEKGITVRLAELQGWWKSILEGTDSTFTFEVVSDFQGVLSINQKLSFKTVNLLNLVFAKADHELLKQNIMYRYQRMKVKKSILQSMLYKANVLIKVKNPSLLH